MKTRNVIALSLLLLGLPLLFPEKNRPHGEHSEFIILPKIEGAASVADQTQRVESSPPLRTPLPDSPKPMQKTAATLLKASESLEMLIQTELTKLGFAQNDIDAAVKEMQSEYLDGDDRVNITRVVDQISDSMKLDSSKRQELNITMINVYLDSLQITFDQWNQCLNYRTTKSSECLKDMAQELSRTVAAGLSGPDWSKEELSLTHPLVDRFVDEGASKCSEPKENVRIALQLNLLQCPL